MTQDKLKQMLDKHKRWLRGESGGERADLRGSNLRGSDLREANLSWSDLRGSDLSGSSLREANLRGSDLSWSSLREANLRGSDLREANLRGSDLREANLSWSDLRGSDLSGSDLSGTGLLTFQYERHQAYCTGERLIIGCIDKPLAAWASDYGVVGKKHGYSDLQIKMYGKFIEMCIEHNGLSDD